MADNKGNRFGIRRRTFLLGGAAGTIALGLGLWNLRGQDTPTRPKVKALPQYGDWRDIHREQWRWDRVAVGTHTNANCVSACAWNLYVRDGIVWREEQSAVYSAPNDTVPDANPRGCQKGSCYSDLSGSANRVTSPLKRVGPRGAGKWQRISWEEALDEVASSLVDTLAKRGGSGVVCEAGGDQDFGPPFVSMARFCRQIGAPITDPNAIVGDLPVGGTITLGEAMSGGSSDDWFRSDYIVLWAFNPSATRIPDAHFLNEARYRGGQVVAIAPDLNQSAIHTDLWLPIQPGTDAALALAACQLIIEENLYDADYIREQTDLPFLVFKETARFVRQSDLEDGGSDEVFAIWDQSSDKLVWAPGSTASEDKTLTLPKDQQATLEIEKQITLLSGTQATVTTVFALLKKSLAVNTPEDAAKVTGIKASAIKRFARDFAKADSALILSQYGGCKNYHSDLAQRAQILLASLTGRYITS
ncbi:MAG: molybdopterin-dependent oxidoreductase [Deltaproteobacteria bacterium]|nr:molybdopterin-dependent oxidoreductase [Deltaproteobacteria bacterium]